MDNQKQQTKQKILEAAETLFIEQGFKVTTTAQIAQKAGCNQALVHYYYQTKEKLFGCIWMDKVKFMLESLVNRNIQSNSVEELVVNIINVHWDFITHNMQLLPFVMRELLNNSDFVSDIVKREVYRYIPRILSSSNNILEKEIKEGKISPISSEDLIMTILSLDVFPFILNSIFQKDFNIPEDVMMEKMEQRKLEVIKTVLARLKK